MTPNAHSLARDIFLQAAQPGPSREPAAVATLLARYQSSGDGTLLNVRDLEDALDAEFPWRNQLVFQSRQPEPGELDAWTQAIRWLMRPLLEADIGAESNARRVQVLLTALGSLDVEEEGLSAVSGCFAGTNLPTGIISMLQRVGQPQEGVDAPTKEWLQAKEWLQDLPDQVKAGNYKMLQHAQRVLLPRFHSDIRTALFLLWKLEPTELAHFLKTRDSIFLDMMVCMVLDANAPIFALQVESLTFKFLSLYWLGRMDNTSPEIEPFRVLEQILLQVAKTPHWKAWLLAKYEHPAACSGESRRALAAVLTKLTQPQWKDFIFALDLSNARGAAEAVADILKHVAAKLGSVQTQPIWSDAFDRWNDWNYGKGERQFYLGSPPVCSLDFPVAMFYAGMPSAERDAIEQELEKAITLVEQQWFSNATEVSSERNRLASRLRLVRHGRYLAAGGTLDLPPAVRPDSEYAEVRYCYHDVNEELSRITGR